MGKPEMLTAWAKAWGCIGKRLTFPARMVKVFLLRSEKFGGDWNNSYLCNYFYSNSMVFML